MAHLELFINFQGPTPAKPLQAMKAFSFKLTITLLTVLVLGYVASLSAPETWQKQFVVWKQTLGNLVNVECSKHRLTVSHENSTNAMKSESEPTLEIAQLVHPSEEFAAELRRLHLTPKPYVEMKTTGQKFHGRFLHITDMHPDDLYKVGGSFDDACHSGKSGEASRFGDAIMGCDSPMELMEETIAWIKKNLRDKVDFVVWTGDNIRHDNDRMHPRTEMHIFDMNTLVAEKLFSAFENTDPNDPRSLDALLVPSLGNNDVYPHNLFSPGPTLQTRELFRIWLHFVPPAQLHIFNRGAYYFQEVIPGHLTVLALNTLYLFQSNPLVDNCDSPKQPGYQLFEWLGVVLKEMRLRNMKVWLSGHVPPNLKNYDISCWRKYTVWAYEYRDVIIGGLYGHMNMDHFIPLDAKAAYKSISEEYDVSAQMKSFDYAFMNDNDNDSDSDSDFEDDEEELNQLLQKYTTENSSLLDLYRVQGGTPYNKVRFLETVREDYYAAIKGRKKSGVSSERYSLVHVSASVIPTFNPGLRVWEYNVTDLAESLNSKVQYASWDEFFQGVDKMVNIWDQLDISEENQNQKDSEIEIMKKKKKGKNGKKKLDKTFPQPKPENLGLGPGYIPQLFTPERYVQYYVDLPSVNNGSKEFDYEFEYSTDTGSYKLKDLTTDEWISFGRKLGKPVKVSKPLQKREEVKCHGMKQQQVDDLDTTKKKNKKHKKKKMFDDDDDKNFSELEGIWQEYLHNVFISSDYEHKGFG